MDSIFPLFNFLAPCGGQPLASQGTFEVLYHSLRDAVEVAGAHRGKVGMIGISNRIEAIYHDGLWIRVFIIKIIDTLQ